MAEKDQKVVFLPEELVQKADTFSSEHHITASQLIELAIEQYISLYHKIELRECMKSGYLEMANINLDLAQ